MTLSCIIRKKTVPATPEEKVRQALIRWMIDSLGYPASQITVEKSISELPHLQGIDVPSLDRRLDVLVYNLDKPLLVIECKAEKIEEKALYQLMGYQHWTGAPFAALAGGNGVKTVYMLRGENTIENGLPRWDTLIKLAEARHDIL